MKVSIVEVRSNDEIEELSEAHKGFLKYNSFGKVYIVEQYSFNSYDDVWTYVLKEVVEFTLKDK
jgi:hypothetical protein